MTNVAGIRSQLGGGTQFEEGMTAKAFLRKAGLDWELRRYPLLADLTAADLVSNTVKVPDRFALLRSTDKKVMTVAGRTWKDWSNEDMVKMMMGYASAGARLEVGGAFRDGMTVWGLARLKRSFEVRKGDKVNGYLLLTTSHVLGKANTVRTMMLRQICTNGMMGWADTVAYSQNHLKAFDITRAKEHVAMADEELGRAEKRARIIDRLKLSVDDMVRKVLVPVFAPQLLTDKEAMKVATTDEGMPSSVHAILESYRNAPGAIEGTGWGLLNGVTHWADHVAGRNASTRAHRAWFGDRAEKKVEVERRLLELAN